MPVNRVLAALAVADVDSAVRWRDHSCRAALGVASAQNPSVRNAIAMLHWKPGLEHH